MIPPSLTSAAVRSCVLRQLAAGALVLALLPGTVGAWDVPGPSAAQAGVATFLVREWSVELPNGDAADVYAPQVPARWRRWFADAFPVVAVLQGALVDKGEYRQFGRLLATQGFVVVVPDHLRNFPGIPVPVRFSEVEVVTAVYDGLVSADADPRSPAHLIVDTDSMGLVGHSLGGFVGLHAIGAVCNPLICSAPDGAYSPPPALRAGAIYGANLVDFDSSIIDLDTSGAAVALMQGTLDGIAPPAEAAATVPVLELPRALITLDGGGHYGICDSNAPVGATPDPLLPTLTQAQSNLYIARWLGLWLRAQLRDDPWAQFWVYQAGGSLDGIVNVVAEPGD